MLEFSKKVLDNGVRLYLYSDKTLKRTFVSYSVKFGSNGLFNDFYYKNKRCKIPFGMAHFLEHTLIEKSKFGNMLHYFADEGYVTNGATYDELTSFYFYGIDNIHDSIKKLIHMVDMPVFNREDIEKVKPAVIEELSGRYDDKFSKVFASNQRNMFKTIEMAHSSFNVLGTKSRTQKFTYEEVKLAYDAYYHDENKILVIAGNIDESEMLNYVTEIYKNIKRHPNNLKKVKRKNLLEVRKSQEIIPYQIKGPSLAIRSYKFENKKKIDPNKLSLYLLIYNFLKFNSGTKFIEELVTNKKLIYMDYLVDFIENIDGFYLIRYIVESNDCNAVFEKLEKELNTDGLSKEKFEQRKKFLIVQNIKKRDYIYNMFGSFTYKLFFTEKLDEVDLIRSLDYDEMLSIIKDMKFDIFSTSIIEYKTS